MSTLTIVPYRPELAPLFKEINEEWIRDMFTLEEKDRKVLGDPETHILKDGGAILFVSVEKLGIVGAGALQKTGPNEYELTKMGVFQKARGFKAGDFLLQALIEKARERRATNLYLLTNKICEAAIHLYEKHGFLHDTETMKRFGSQYQRCDVAMRHRDF